MLLSKIKKSLSIHRILAFAGLSALVVISFHPIVRAQAVTEGYSSDQVLQRGMIIRLKKDDNTKVEPVSSEASDQMYGVVVNANDAAVTIASEGQKVFVATTGTYDVLVSSQNGNVSQGDYVAVSAVSGIGMKASTNEPIVIGRALSGFDGSNGVISSNEVKDSDGKTHKINIGRVSVSIGVAKNPILKATEANIPAVLKKAAESVAGKPVNVARIYIGILVFGITTIVAGSLLYGGVKSAIISIGRNPLSKKSIIRSMVQVIITGLIVFLTGVFGVYLILRI